MSSAGVTTLLQVRPPTGKRFSIAKATPCSSAIPSTSFASHSRAPFSQRNGAWATMALAPIAAVSSRARWVFSM